MEGLRCTAKELGHVPRPRNFQAMGIAHNLKGFPRTAAGSSHPGHPGVFGIQVPATSCQIKNTLGSDQRVFFIWRASRDLNPGHPA